MKESITGAIIGALVVSTAVAIGFAVHEGSSSSNASHHVQARSAISSTPVKTHLAAKSVPLSSENVLSIVKKASDGKLVVNKAFAGPYPDMTGVEASSVTGKGGHLFLWIITPPALKSPIIFTGNTYDITGANLTKQYLLKEGLITPSAAENAAQNNVPANSAVDSPASALQHTWDDPASFVIGNKGPEIAVIIDPNCFFCHKFLTQTVFPMVKEGKLRARIIPAGFLHPSSAGKAWHILAKGHSALMEDEANFNIGKESGSLKPYTLAQANSQKIPGTDLTLAQGVMANNMLLADIGKGQLATPTVIFNNNGKLSSISSAMSQAQLEQYLSK